MEVGQPELGFKGALARAYRRAYKRGIREVGTDLVLWSAYVSVPGAWSLLPPFWSRAWRPVRRGRAGLTDPDPLEWTHDSDSLRFETDAVLVEFHGQVAAAGNPWPDEVARWNQAGEVLAAYGVEGREPPMRVARSRPEPGDAEDDLASVPTRGWPQRAEEYGAPKWAGPHS